MICGDGRSSSFCSGQAVGDMTTSLDVTKVGMLYVNVGMVVEVVCSFLHVFVGATYPIRHGMLCIDQRMYVRIQSIAYDSSLL